MLICLCYGIGRWWTSDTGARWHPATRASIGEATISFGDASYVYQYLSALYWSTAVIALSVGDLALVDSRELMFCILGYNDWFSVRKYLGINIQL
jgi:hypothetical protein